MRIIKVILVLLFIAGLISLLINVIDTNIYPFEYPFDVFLIFTLSVSSLFHFLNKDQTRPKRFKFMSKSLNITLIILLILCISALIIYLSLYSFSSYELPRMFFGIGAIIIIMFLSLNTEREKDTGS